MKYRTHIIFAVLTVVVTVWLSAPVDQGYVDPAWRLGQMLSPYHPPQWSADGEFVAFTHEQVLYVVGSDGSGLRRLTGVGDVGRAPNTSPVDAHIVYTAGKHGGWFIWPNEYRLDIVTSALDGSDRRRLTKSDNPRVEYLNPVWSPDGTRIAFSSNRTGREEPESRQEASGPFATYTMASDGSDVRGIAPGMPARRMAWSPDGRRLALVANEISGALYTVGADGSGLTRLGETGGLPGWSPDGSRLAFVRREGDAEAVVTVAPDGSNVTKVLGHRDLFTLSFRDVSWSPDGTRILVSGRLAGDGAVIVVVNADGSDPRRLFAMPSKHALDLAASWSPDGSRIAIYSREPQFTDGLLVTMANDGSDARILVKYTRNRRVFEAGHGAPFSWFEPTESELVRNWNEWRLREAITPEETGGEKWQQWGRMWPEVSAQGLRKTRPGGVFDVSAVDVTNFPEMDCWVELSSIACDLWKKFPDLGIAGYDQTVRGDQAAVYFQIKDPPTDQAELKALKDRLVPCHDVIGRCTYQSDGETRSRTISATTTVGIIPAKYDYRELWRWATILVRFRESPGNTIEIRNARVAWNSSDYGRDHGEALYLNGLNRFDELRPETRRQTIRVTGRDSRRLVLVLPVLLPQLGIPVDAVGMVSQGYQ